MGSEFKVHNLESHKTKDTNDAHINGELTVVWRDWDKIINDPKLVYVNTIGPSEIKGPHIHKNRTSYFYCIQGEMVIILKDKKETIHEITASSDENVLVEVSNGTAAAILNPSITNSSKVLVLADIAWKPNDNEMTNVLFENYNWAKWK